MTDAYLPDAKITVPHRFASHLVHKRDYAAKRNRFMRPAIARRAVVMPTVWSAPSRRCLHQLDCSLGNFLQLSVSAADILASPLHRLSSGSTIVLMARALSADVEDLTGDKCCGFQVEHCLDDVSDRAHPSQGVRAGEGGVGAVPFRPCAMRVF